MLIAISAPVVADAGVLVLRDGRALRYEGELRRRDGLVLFSLPDSTLVSLRDSEVDWPASARATGIVARAAAAEPPRDTAPGGADESTVDPVRIYASPPRRAGPSDEVSTIPDSAPLADVNELDGIDEGRLLQALVHSGRKLTRREPGDRPGGVVDLLLVQEPELEQPAPEQPAPEQPTPEQPTPKQPTPEQPTPAARPSAPLLLAAAEPMEPPVPPREPPVPLREPPEFALAGLQQTPSTVTSLDEPPAAPVAVAQAGPEPTALQADRPTGEPAVVSEPVVPADRSDRSDVAAPTEPAARPSPQVTPPRVPREVPAAVIEVARLTTPEPTTSLPSTTELVSPRDGEYVYGPTTLRVRPGRDGAPVTRVEFRVDGAAVGRVDRSPWEMIWAVPAERAQHRIEALIRRIDGSVEQRSASVWAIVPDVAMDVDLVVLTVAVSNQQYLFVRDLTEADFAVTEDGVFQQISHFRREAVPVSVLVLVDASWSMNGRKLEMAASGVELLAERLGPEDRLGLAVFNEEVRVLAPLGPDHRAAATALRTVTADGTTAMFDAEIEALGQLRWEGGKRVLLILGDGEDYVSEAKLEDVVQEAHRLNVAVYSIGTLTYRLKDGLPEHWSSQLGGRARPRYWSDGLRVRGLKFLRKQAEETGGVLYLPKFSGELPYVFAHILAELKSAYSIGYYPSNTVADGRFREVDVLVAGTGLEARTRKGYYPKGAVEARRAHK